MKGKNRSSDKLPLNTAISEISAFEKSNNKEGFITKRVAFLRSFTIEPIVTLYRATAIAHQMDIKTYVSGFNTYIQEILASDSPLYKFDPQIVIFAVQLRDILPKLWDGFSILKNDEIGSIIEKFKVDFKRLLDTFRSHTKAHLIIHNFETMPNPGLGILDGQNEFGQILTINRLNLELVKLAKEYNGVYILNYNNLVHQFGAMAWFDQEKFYTMRMPVAADAMGHLANEWIRFMYPLIGRSKKVLVVDLDNTLWKGVIGEDGIEGLKLDDEYHSGGYLQLQSAILDLYHRGIILAICSKNNIDDIKPAFEHPRMVLRLNHFATWRINWKSKVENLIDIAQELNVGLDSMVFLDDSKTEKQLVRSLLPQIKVVDLADDPYQLADTLRIVYEFERLGLSEEDLNRGEYYAKRQQENELKKNKLSLDEYYRSLSLEADVFGLNSSVLTRAVQLIQKTNQFNLTTKRYTQEDISQMLQSGEYQIYCLSVRNCFGDHGITGLAMIQNKGNDRLINLFLLSCRIIGLKLETAFLSMIAEKAQKDGSDKLIGLYSPTAKNEIVKDFYNSHGFKCIVQDVEGSQWQLDLKTQVIKPPEWIKSRFIEKGALDGRTH